MLSEVQLEELRGVLIGELTTIYRQVRADIDETLVADLYESDPTDEAEDGATDELQSELDEPALEEAHRAEDALARMRRPGYGRCIDCGQEIPFARLRAAPWVERCIDDQERYEEQLRAAGEAPPTM
jgi:RNA polymerase-binding transcription factor DksA